MKHNRSFGIANKDVEAIATPSAVVEQAVTLAYHPISKIVRQFMLALLISSSFNVFANDTWSYHQESDRLSNRTYSFALSPLPPRGLYDNIRLEVICKDTILQVIIDADSLIASQGSPFDFEYQIDKKPPVALQMNTFKDSKRRGYTEESAKRIVNDLLTGQSVFIRVNTMIRKVLSAAMTLENAAEPIKRVAGDCGLSLADNAAAEPAYNLSAFEQDFGKLPTEQQQQMLAEIKKIMEKALLKKK